MTNYPLPEAMLMSMSNCERNDILEALHVQEPVKEEPFKLSTGYLRLLREILKEEPPIATMRMMGPEEAIKLSYMTMN